MKFWDGSTSNLLKISITYLKSRKMAQFRLNDSVRWFLKKFNSRYWLLRTLNYLRVLGLKMSSFQAIFSWAISKCHTFAFTWQQVFRWLFVPSQGQPCTEVAQSNDHGNRRGNMKCPKKHVKDVFFTWGDMHIFLKCIILLMYCIILLIVLYY